MLNQGQSSSTFDSIHDQPFIPLLQFKSFIWVRRVAFKMGSIAGGLPFRFLDTEQSSMMPLQKSRMNSAFIEDQRLFPKFPTGNPLDEYRKSASFDWRKMKVFMKGEEAINLQVSDENKFP